MATVTTTYLVDDIDGSTGDVETVEFSLDKHLYEIDLSSDNAARLREKLGKYVTAAAPVHNVKRVAKKQIVSGAVSKEMTQAIRHWAKENGFDIAERGRIPANVRRAFEDAH